MEMMLTCQGEGIVLDQATCQGGGDVVNQPTCKGGGDVADQGGEVVDQTICQRDNVDHATRN